MDPSATQHVDDRRVSRAQGTLRPPTPKRENDNDSDIDHSSNQLLVHQAVTCPEGKSAGSLTHSLFGEIVRIMQKESLEVYLCKPRVT